MNSTPKRMNIASKVGSLSFVSHAETTDLPDTTTRFLSVDEDRVAYDLGFAKSSTTRPRNSTENRRITQFALST